jgi:integrative and conjugative element protein (TIGR02256 family)
LGFHKQRNLNDHEKGGIILGKIINQSIHLCKLSVPTELDKSSRYNFERNRISAQIIINYEHFNSHGQMTYLGEWHTHPEDLPVPSDTDVKMIKEQFSKNKINTDFLILAIQGRKKLYIGVLDGTGLHSAIL